MTTIQEIMPEMVVTTSVGRTFTFETMQHLALRLGYARMIWRSWPVAPETSDTPGDVILCYDEGSSIRTLVEAPDALVHTDYSDGAVTVSIAGATQAAIDAALAGVEARFPRAAPFSDELRIPLWLWTLTPQGPRGIRRMIDVPAWQDIEQNYSAAVQQQLNALMQERPESGRMILWHGVPGSGKTFALRALGHAWRSFCDLHYVVDTEVLFGRDTHYLIDVLLAGEGGGGPAGGQSEERWRLLVLEDSGEMLTMDAKERVGQALSRLLNVTDGLLGQGLRVMILVTTNEHLGELHPAISRSGRCAAAIPFTALSAAEAEAWLRRRGITQAVGATTVADLYGLLTGQPVPQRRARLAGLVGTRA